jgi:molecular chaperone DnaJ
MKNPYEVLGLDENASQEELETRYKKLKEEYSEGRFLAGEEGMIAARNLTELENAWREIQAKTVVAEETKGGGDFEYIERLIKDSRYDDAQTVLDSISEREGEWHYYQSIIYYKREWLAECKKQLEAAIACDPGNQKYRTTLEKLNIVMGNSKTNPESMGQNPNMNQQYVEQPHGDALSNCCLAYCFTSLCCDCMQCCM